MLEEEILSFPADAAVAFLAISPQSSFVRLRLPMAAGARGIERSGAVNRSEHSLVVTTAALRDEMSPDEVERCVPPVIKDGLLGNPFLRGMAGGAGGSIPRWVFHGVTIGTLGSESGELS